MTLRELLDTNLSKVSNRELLQSHLRLHQWFSIEDISKEDVIKAHDKVFIEFTRRGIHHTHKNDLDSHLPEISSESYAEFLKIESLIVAENQTQIAIRHSALHNIWSSFKVNKNIEDPPEELVNVHSLLVMKMEANHPKWDELDKDIFDALSKFRVIKSDNLLDLFQVTSIIHDKVCLLPNAAQVNNKDIFIAPGLGGVLKANITRYISQNKGNVYSEVPLKDPDSSYSLVLVKSGLNPTHRVLVPIHTLCAGCCYVSGFISEFGISMGKVDILIINQMPEWLSQHIISMLTISNQKYSDMIKFVVDENNTSSSSTYLPVYDLALEFQY